ncbi:hypothetical protein [Nonomuraea sp. SYSU D8015]|uniref:hypothetical protein n=1 Tax=Nonomuraea sp. SYSU D8015 TaxID=2593644 RepID=UPI0016617A34|nr:hypothetical protein [Nonomuraea sp. SYSU D8015]
MQGGDLSSEVLPTVLVVFETVIATPPAAGPTRRWRKAKPPAADAFAWDQTAEAALWRLTLRADVNVELVTFMGEEVASSIREVLRTQNFPARTAWAADSPEALARQLAYMPYVSAVYDGDPVRQFTYGNRTRIVTSHNKQFLGAF